MGFLVEGLSVTVIGIFIVFSVLFLISLMIGMFSKIFNKPSEEPKKKVEPEVKTITAVENDYELIAVITAAIAASMNTSVDNLQVRSIKKIYPWIEAGRITR